MKNKYLFIPLTILGLIVLIVLDALVKAPSKKDETVKKTEKKDQYNSYGLPNGQSLSEDILFETDDIVCFEDRLVKRFSYSNEQLSAANSTFDKLKQLSNSELMLVPIPGRVIYEEGYSTDKEEYSRFIDALRETMPEECNLVDLREVFRKYSDEYIYYRTENSITPLGGLYAANYIVTEKGGEALNRDKFQTFMYNDFRGDFYESIEKQYENAGDYETVSLLEAIPKDPLKTYLINAENFSEILYTTQEEYYKRPAILTSSIGDTAILGRSFLYIDIKGKARSFPEESVLLICDDAGKCIAPYLAYYYKKVMVIQMSNSMITDELLMKLTDECDYVVWAQMAEEFGTDISINMIRPAVE